MTNEEIANLYNSGLSIQKVSELSGISNTQIRRILKKLNIKSRSHRTNQVIEHQIFERYNNGENSELIAKNLNINPSTVCRIIKRLGGNIRSPKENKRKYNIIHNYFENIDCEYKAYFLGFLMADGNVHCKYNSAKLSVHEQDIDILEKLRSALFPNEKPKICSDRNIYKILNITSSQIKNDLISYGCVPNKTFKLKLPSLGNLQRHFLRGFYDGDGCINISNNRVRSILTGYTGMLKEIQKFLHTLNIDSIISEVKPNVSSLVVSKNKDTYMMLNFLYKDSTIFLNRKYNKYKDCIQILEDKLKPAFNYGSENIVSINSTKLSQSNILAMSLEEKIDISNHVFNYFREHGFPYPLSKDEELQIDFKKLLLSSSTITEDGTIGNLGFAGIKIFKHFSPHYFEVKNSSLQSMVSAFDDDELLKAVIRNRMGIDYKETFGITGNMIRQGFRNSHKAFAASIFKPTLAKTIYDHYAPENSKVLDISLGFGQRLLGAMASKNVAKYVGIDPWDKQIQGANNIIKFFNFNNAEVFCTGSENFTSNEIFDFCFSSPPFYDKEQYTDQESQAWFGSYEGFLSWWRETVENVHCVTKENSLFVLNMSEKYIDDMLAKCRDLFVLEKTNYINYQRSHIGKDSRDMFYVLRRI